MGRSSKGKLSSSIKKTRGNETRKFGVDLPPGIKSGVATLIDGEIGTYKSGNQKGELYLRLAGTVLKPLKHTYTPKVWKKGSGGKGTIENLDSVSVKTKGLRTQVMFPLCETPRKSEEENVDLALNMLRLLGANTEELEDVDDLKELVKDLVDEGITFGFRTQASTVSQDYPEERTFENWDEAIDSEDLDDDDDDNDDIDEDDDVKEDDEDESDEDSDEDSEDDEEEEDEDEDEDDESEDPPFGDSDELEELADKAEKGSRSEKKKAQDELDKRAQAAGLDTDSDEYEDLEWHEIAQKIREADTDVDDDEEDDEDSPPENGESYMYKPPRKRKAVEVTVKTVNKRKQTCTLADGSGNEYKNIPWDKLEDA